MPDPSHRSLLALVLFSGVLAASTAAIFIRLAQSEGAASIVIAAARLTLASLLLTPWALSRHRQDLRRLHGRDWLLALSAGIFLALHFASWISSLEYTTVASSVVLVSSTPLWVGLLAPLVLKERLDRKMVLGLLLALAGGIVVGLSDSCRWITGGLPCPSMADSLAGRAVWGDLLALGGAWMAAGYLLIGRSVRAKLELVPYIFIVYSMAAAILLLLMLVTGESPAGLPAPTYLWFLLLALFPQLVGHSSFNWALRYLPASFVAVTLLGEPIGSSLLAFLLFQEAPGPVKIGGAVLILSGIWLAARGSEKGQAPEPAQTSQ
jgi:drug/metabolite transporter (DMT)-like permease